MAEINIVVCHRGGLNAFRNINNRVTTYFTEGDAYLQVRTINFDLNGTVSVSHYYNYIKL